jgi:hypothetical protein
MKGNMINGLADTRNADTGNVGKKNEDIGNNDAGKPNIDDKRKIAFMKMLPFCRG